MFSRLCRAPRTAKVLGGFACAVGGFACTVDGTAARVWLHVNGPVVQEPAVQEEDKWKILPEHKKRIAGLHGANFKRFFETCPLKADGTFVVGPALDAHIRRHEDLEAHYPFTDAQHKRVLELTTQAGSPGFLANFMAHMPVKRTPAEMDEYIEAHAPIAAEVEQQWNDVACVRSRWWIYKHAGSDEVVSNKTPWSEDDFAERIAQQQQAYEAAFPGATAKREEIRRLSKEAEKRVKELVKAWA